MPVSNKSLASFALMQIPMHMGYIQMAIIYSVALTRDIGLSRVLLS